MTDNFTPTGYGFGLAKISGITGKLIWLGQLLAGRPSKWEHAFVILPDGANFSVVEAEPGGARLTPLSEYWDAKQKRWDCVFVYPPLTDQQKSALDAAAMQMLSTPYGWLDYISLALLHLHIRPQWVVDRVAGGKGMICSQLVDYVYEQAGVHFFDDGRFPGDVMPADLDYLARQNGWTA